MIEMQNITTVDVHGGVIEITGDGDEERHFIYPSITVTKPFLFNPDCRWLPQPVEVAAR